MNVMKNSAIVDNTGLLRMFQQLEEDLNYHEGHAALLYGTLEALVQAVHAYFNLSADDAMLSDALKEADSILEL